MQEDLPRSSAFFAIAFDLAVIAFDLAVIASLAIAPWPPKPLVEA